MNLRRGFTYIEILVVLGIVAIVSMFIIPGSVSKSKKEALAATADGINAMIFVQQQDAFNGRNGKGYGLKFNQSNLVLFVGDSYATAESLDTIDIATGMYIQSINLSTGGTELTFELGSLSPSAYGEIVLSNGVDSYKIVITEQGLIYITANE